MAKEGINTWNQLAEILKMKPSTVSTLKRAAESNSSEGPDRQIPFKIILDWALSRKVNIDWLLTGEEPPSKIAETPEIVFVAKEEGGRVHPRFDMEGRYVAVPLLADSAAAGEPSEIDESNVDSWAIIYKDRNWIPHSPENYTCVRIRGSSMYPILAEGDIVAIDHAERPHNHYDLKRLNGKMVAFRINGGVTIKWLRYDEEQDLVIGVPENHDELDRLVSLRGDDIMDGVIGLVRWWWSKR